MSREGSSARKLRWQPYIVGDAALEEENGRYRFIIAETADRQYADAQIDDYHDLPRRRFPWRPPLRLQVRARFSHPAGQLRGTAGFGFWNDPFLMTGFRLPALPRALWFFYGSPPSNLRLDLETPGRGWKAATIDASRPSALTLAPLVPLAIPLMNVRRIYRWVWPKIQRAINVRESLLEVDMTQWHTYAVRWETERTAFWVDDRPALRGVPSPHGPLGFVMWLDNQYMIVTPQGKFGWGVLDIPERQWMAVDAFSIEPL